jgi:REP element-mobilizing transposase RayT
MDNNDQNNYIARKKNRLVKYDYSKPGGYFITICTNKKENTFGSITDGEIKLSYLGNLARNNWSSIAEHFPMVEVGEFVIMPNHLHGILYFQNNFPSIGMNDNNLPVTIPKISNLKDVVGSFKMSVTREVRKLRPGLEVWQRNYYDHVIRNEQDEQRIVEYIQMNPIRWADDDENQKRLK